MPYIKPEDREKYEDFINKLLPPEKGIFSMELMLMIADLEKLVDTWVANSGSIALADLPKAPMDAAGHLNYIISSCIWRALGPDANYATRCWVAGTLEIAKQRRIGYNEKHGFGVRSTLGVGIFSDVLNELYRRQTAAYEDRKISEHGDIV